MNVDSIFDGADTSTAPQVIEDVPPGTIPDNEGDGFYCDVCGRSDFQSERGLKKHKTQAHGIKTDKAPRQSGGRSGSLEKQLADFLMPPFVILSAFDPVCGPAFVESVPNTCKAIAHLCEKNAGVKKIVQRMLKGSDYALLFAALAHPIGAIILHHVELPPAGEHVLEMFTGIELEEVEEDATAAAAPNGASGSNAADIMARLSG